jgi:hypothetical protein
VQLGEVLMGHSEAHSVLTKLRKHFGQSQGGKALEFVDVDEKVSSLGEQCIRTDCTRRPRLLRGLAERGALAPLFIVHLTNLESFVENSKTYLISKINGNQVEATVCCQPIATPR